MNHLPEWSEALLVEINVNHIVSEECKKAFKKEVRSEKARLPDIRRRL